MDLSLQMVRDIPGVVKYHYKEGNFNWPMIIYISLVHTAAFVGLFKITHCMSETLLWAFILWPIRWVDLLSSFAENLSMTMYMMLTYATSSFFCCLFLTFLSVVLELLLVYIVYGVIDRMKPVFRSVCFWCFPIPLPIKAVFIIGHVIIVSITNFRKLTPTHTMPLEGCSLLIWVGCWWRTIPMLSRPVEKWTFRIWWKIRL